MTDPVIVDDAFLESLGLEDLPAAERTRLRRMLQSQLEMRLGLRLGKLLPDEALVEFSAIAARQDALAAEAWVKTRLPGYRYIVAAELAKLRREILRMAKDGLNTNLA